jgi:hypothetical protein
MIQAVQSKNVCNHYDLNLDGWLRINSRYYWFEIEDDWQDVPLEKTPRYWIYEITDRKVKAENLIDHRRFRHLVGWHCCYLARDGWKTSRFGEDVKPGWKEYFDTRPKPSEDGDARWKASKKLVGYSDDYNLTVVFEPLHPPGKEQ